MRALFSDGREMTDLPVIAGHGERAKEIRQLPCRKMGPGFLGIFEAG